MERDEEFRRLLTTILAAGVPEPAARLKQRLAAACREQGRPPFDHKTAGYKRFKDYLLRHADLITLSEGVGGCMVVYLRSDERSVGKEGVRKCRSRWWSAL